MSGTVHGTRMVRTALILRCGPKWGPAGFNDIKRGDVFILLESGGDEADIPCVAVSDAEVGSPLDLGVVRAEPLYGFTKDTVSSIYGPATRAGFKHDRIVRGLLAMRKDENMKKEALNDGDVGLAAKVAHEVNRAFCQIIGEDPHLAWEDAPDWQRKSARAGVQMIKDNPKTTPEDLHNGWLAHKEQSGWVYGKEKDAEKKTHPCMVPYDQLPLEQRIKDHLFGASVRAVLGIS